MQDVTREREDSVDRKGWVRLINNVYRGTKDVQGIGDLRVLEHLDVSGNQLRRLPYGLGLCISLKVLKIGVGRFGPFFSHSTVCVLVHVCIHTRHTYMHAILMFVLIASQK
jgi:hypothetical protein